MTRSSLRAKIRALGIMIDRLVNLPREEAANGYVSAGTNEA